MTATTAWELALFSIQVILSVPDWPPPARWIGMLLAGITQATLMFGIWTP